MAATDRKIRNVAVVGSRGTGKTSLVEALLYQTGEVDRAQARSVPLDGQQLDKDRPSATDVDCADTRAHLLARDQNQSPGRSRD